jgi:hypothetical protein
MDVGSAAIVVSSALQIAINVANNAITWTSPCSSHGD